LTADGAGNYPITIQAQVNVLKVEYDGEPISMPNNPNEPSGPLEEPTDPPDDSPAISVGCNGSIAFSNVAILAAISTALFLRKREE
jgi:hypothetical protein